MNSILSRDNWMSLSTACGDQALKDVPCTVDNDSTEADYLAWFTAHRARYTELMGAAVAEAEAAELQRRNVRTRTTYSVLVG